MPKRTVDDDIDDVDDTPLGKKLAKLTDNCRTININEIIIDDITFTIICKSEQDDQGYNYPESVREGSCYIQRQYIERNR